MTTPQQPIQDQTDEPDAWDVEEDDTAYPEFPSNPHEAPLSVNFSPGKAPQLTFRARNVTEWNTLIQRAIDSGVFATIQKAYEQFSGQAQATPPPPPPALQQPNQPYQGQPAWQQAGAPQGAPTPPPPPQSGGNGGGNKPQAKPRPTDWPGTVYMVSIAKGDDSFRDYRNANKAYFAGKIRWNGGGNFWVHQDVAQALAQWNPVPA